MARRPASEIESRWSEVFDNPLLSTETFKANATLGGSSSSCLRSVFWRVWLAKLPLPLHSEDVARGQGPHFSPAWELYVHSTREEYESLKRRYLATPDAQTQGSDLPRSPGQLQAVAAEDDPLNQGTNSSWADWHEGQQLRHTIMLDVERSFPENDFFRSSEVHEIMANILQVWSKLSDYGYRQGIHELLGCILEAVYLDSIQEASLSLDNVHAGDAGHLATCRLVLDARYVEHDSYALFHRLMLQAGSFYDPTPMVPMPLSQSNSFKVEQPIVAQLHRIVHVVLANIDPALTTKLKTLEIEPQLFGLRWLRLLFTREFPLPEALDLWDALFAEDPTLKLADFIVLAMLLRIRSELLAAEYSEALQLLLRYPQPEDGDYHIDALFHQARLLRDNPTPSGASMIKQQNKALGFGGGATPRESRSPVSSSRRASPLHSRSESMQLPFGHASRSFQVPNSGAFGDLARNVYARAESTGFNRAIGDFARSLGQPPPVSSPPTQTDFRGHASRRSQSFQTSEVESLRRQQRTYRNQSTDVASALGLCTTVLQQADSAEAVKLVLPVVQHLQDVLSRQQSAQPAALDQRLLQTLASYEAAGSDNAVKPNRPPLLSLSTDNSERYNTATPTAERAAERPTPMSPSPRLGHLRLDTEAVPSRYPPSAPVDGKDSAFNDPLGALS